MTAEPRRFTASLLAERRARVAFGPLTALAVVDRFAEGAGSMDGRLFGRIRLFHADDENTTGPNGQFPRLAITTTPSQTRAVITGRKNGRRRPVSAHHHTYPIDARNPIATRPWAARQITIAGDNAALGRAAEELRMG